MNPGLFRAEVVEYGFEGDAGAGAEEGVAAQGALGGDGGGVEPAEETGLLAGLAESGGILLREGFDLGLNGGIHGGRGAPE